MRVVIRVDASQWIGSGHAMRCLVLAEELTRRKHNVMFACLPQVSDKIELIKKRGFSVLELTPPTVDVVPQRTDDYQAWLQRSVADDADDFISLVDRVDIVITDHYSIGSEWQSIIKSALGCKVVAIDDLKRCHNADLIIDQTLGRLPEEYDRSVNVLAGTEYALLNPLFYQSRCKALEKSLNPIAPKVLISMGGIDQPNVTLKVLQILQSFENASFTVLLGSGAPHYAKVVDFCSKNKGFLHIDFVHDMAALMLMHDIAIGAPGTTSWERACLGLPSVIIPIAKNQNEIAHRLEQYGISICLDMTNLKTELPEALSRTLNQASNLRNESFRSCDGLGVFRVASEIEQIQSNKSFVRLIKASEKDIERVYQWQCHPGTRKYALNPEVPTWEEHYTWMSKKLSNNFDFFYLITDKYSGEKVGALRLDKIEGLDYVVSIFVDPYLHSKGVASKALILADSIHPMLTLHATVLKENKASQRLFEKVGYERLSPEKFIRRSMI